MLGIMTVSESGDQSLIIIPSLDDPAILLVCVEWLGLENPPIPVPVEALRAMLEALDAKS